MPGLFNALAPLFAQNPPAGGAGGQNPAMWTIGLYAAVIGLWFYFLLIRPQQKQEKSRRMLIDALKKNDKVLTTAGIYGTVVSVDNEHDRVMVRIDDDRGGKVAFTKASIVRVIEGSSEKEKNKEKATEVA